MGITREETYPSKRLLDWFDNNNARWDPSAIQLSAGRIRPVVRLDKSLRLAGIPKKVILSPRTCGASNLFDDVELPPGLLSLALALIFERDVIGKESPWWPYVSKIRNKGDRRIPPLWTKEEIDGFRHTSAEHHVKTVITDFHARYKKFVVPLIEDHPESFPQTLFGRTQVLNALDVVTYRAFAIDEYHVVALVPFADSLERVSLNANTTLEIFGSVCIYCGAAGGCDHVKAESDRHDPKDPELVDALEELDYLGFLQSPTASGSDLDSTMGSPRSMDDLSDSEFLDELGESDSEGCDGDRGLIDEAFESNDGEWGSDDDPDSDCDEDEELIHLTTLKPIRNSASSSLTIMHGNLGEDVDDLGAPNVHLISTFGFAILRNPLDPIIVSPSEIEAACTRIGADEEVVHTARQVVSQAKDENDISNFDCPFGMYAFIPLIERHDRSQCKDSPCSYRPGPNLLRLLIACNVGSQLIDLWNADRAETIREVENLACHYERNRLDLPGSDDEDYSLSSDSLMELDLIEPLVNVCAMEIAQQRSRRIPIWTVRDSKKSAPTTAEAMARTLRESESWALKAILSKDIGCKKPCSRRR